MVQAQLHMRFNEWAAVLCGVVAMGLTAMAVLDPTWTTRTDTIFNIDGTGRNETRTTEDGLISTRITYPNGTVVYPTVNSNVKFAGQVTFLVLISAGACTLLSVYYLFRVGMGLSERDSGHKEAMKWSGVAAFLFIGAGFVYNIMYPEAFNKHPLHLGDGFWCVLVSAQLVLFLTVMTFFAYSRESLI